MHKESKLGCMKWWTKIQLKKLNSSWTPLTQLKNGGNTPTYDYLTRLIQGSFEENVPKNALRIIKPHPNKEQNYTTLFETIPTYWGRMMLLTEAPEICNTYII